MTNDTGKGNRKSIGEFIFGFSCSWDSLQEAATAMNIGNMVEMLAYGARGVMLKESRTSSSVGSVQRVNSREHIFSGELYVELQFK